MDREKLEEALRLSIARVLEYRVDKYEVEIIADHLISNGIGDITAEKHRADVAEEALKILCENCVECPYIIEDTNKYCKAPIGDGTEECDASKAYLCWAEYYKQQAEARPAELEDSDGKVYM